MAVEDVALLLNGKKRRMLRLLESYVIRRSVCGLPRDHYNLYTANICGKFGDDPKYADMHRMFKNAEGDSVLFPDDDKVIEASAVDTKFYGSPSQRYMFEQIEEFMSKDKDEVSLNKGILTTDHILPQGWKANEEWRRILLEY